MWGLLLDNFEKWSLAHGLSKNFAFNVFCILLILLAGSILVYIFKNVYLNLSFFNKKRSDRLHKQAMEEAIRQINK